VRGTRDWLRVWLLDALEGASGEVVCAQARNTPRLLRKTCLPGRGDPTFVTPARGVSLVQRFVSCAGDSTEEQLTNGQGRRSAIFRIDACVDAR